MAFGTGARWSSSCGAAMRRVSREPRGEERSFRRIVRELERAAVRGARVLWSSERAEKLGPRRVEQVVPVELLTEREQLDVRGLGASDVPERDRAIEAHHGRVGEPEERVVRTEDLCPARRLPGGRLRVRARDERLQLVR